LQCFESKDLIVKNPDFKILDGASSSIQCFSVFKFANGLRWHPQYEIVGKREDFGYQGCGTTIGLDLVKPRFGSIDGIE
jgi:hypothetical protein